MEKVFRITFCEDNGNVMFSIDRMESSAGAQQWFDHRVAQTERAGGNPVKITGANCQCVNAATVRCPGGRLPAWVERTRRGRAAARTRFEVRAGALSTGFSIDI